MFPRPCVDVIVGGQFGSEGKGKLAAHLASKNGYSVAVRVGGPNSGHTVQIENTKYCMRQLSCAGLVDKDVKLCIAPGGLINEELLRHELDIVPNAKNRLIVDPNVGVITERHRLSENARRKIDRKGFGADGIGDIVADKALRADGFLRAEEIGWLKPYLHDVPALLNGMVDRGESILIEGTQGFGISLNFGYWPYVVSRDVIVSSFLSDCGLSPRSVGSIYMVIRPYPVRVGGNTGTMGTKEINWSEVENRSGASVGSLTEISPSSGKERRVSEFNEAMFLRAVAVNRPTAIALMFSQQINWNNLGAKSYDDLSDGTREFVEHLQDISGVPVAIVGTGLEHKEIVNRWENGSIIVGRGYHENTG